VSTDDEIGKSIYPDIVVHQREIPNNSARHRVRKASNHQPPEHDQHKLRALTDPHLWFAYRIGVLLALGRKNVTASRFYVGGVHDRPLSGWLAGRLEGWRVWPDRLAVNAASRTGAVLLVIAAEPTRRMAADLDWVLQKGPRPGSMASRSRR